MTQPLRVLLLEDNSNDAGLLSAALENQGLVAEVVLVRRRADFEAALSQPWDLILADFAVPGFDAQAALALVRRAVTENREPAERRCAGIELLQSEARLRASFDHAGVGMAEFSPDARWLRVNPRLSRKLGVDPATLLGQSFMAQVDPADRERMQVLWQGLLRGEQELGDTELRLHTSAPGRAIWVHGVFWADHDDSGAVQYLGATFVDISPRKHSEQALRESEQRLAGIVATAMDAIVTIDAAQRIVLFNAAAEAMFGCAAAQAIGSPIERFLPQHFRANHAEHVRRFMTGGTTTRAMGRLESLWGLRASGEEFPIEAAISKLQAGASTLATVVLRDISARRAAEAALRASEQRLRLAEQIGRIGHFEWNITGRWVHRSAEMAVLWGQPAVSTQLGPDLWREFIHPQDLAMIEQCIAQALQSGSFEAEWRVIWPDGTQRWLAGRAVVERDAAGQPHRMLGVHIDITDRKALEERVRRAAQHDPLTGLHNRALLFEAVTDLLPLMQRAGQMAALLFIDLDHFKSINDTHGHDVGDRVLQEVAQRLLGCVREADLLARLGGDEFVVVLAQLYAEADVMPVAQHILARLGQPYLINEGELHLSPSIGISLYPIDADTVEELVRLSDKAMYSVKQNGKNNVCFYRPGLDALTRW